MDFIKKKGTRYLITLFIIISLNFFIPRLMPGDPLVYLIGEDAAVDPGTIAALKAELGLDRPLFIQYVYYWKQIIRFDFGYSYHLRKPVSRIILAKLPWTLGLLLPPLLLGAFLGMLLGALSGWRRDNFINKCAAGAAVGLYAAPPYFIALLLLSLFSLHWEIFPLKGFYRTGTAADILHHYFLPVVVLTLFTAARNYMIMRGSVLLEKDKLYVLYARAKGVYGDAALFRHIFKNAALPSVTMIALDFGFIFSGALLIEIVFSMDGMGVLIYQAILSRDYPLLQGIFLVISTMVIAAGAAADFLYSRLDPRVRERS